MSLAVLDRGLGVAMFAVAADHPFAVPVPGGKKDVCVCVCVCVCEREREREGAYVCVRACGERGGDEGREVYGEGWYWSIRRQHSELVFDSQS